mgnify:CR=1 FL=1
MNDHKRNGFSAIEVIIVLVVVGLIAMLAWFGLKKNKADAPGSKTTVSQPTSGNKQSTTKYITWMTTGDGWQASGTPPTCKEPVTFSTPPSDLSTASAVLYPGQTRGGNYKPHGGLRYDNSGGNVTVRAIYDGKLVSGSRYIEMGEVQYMFTVVNDCGIAYRFDHLLTLSPRIQAVMDTLPAPQPNNSQTTNFKSPISVKVGEVVATAVGFPKIKNYGYDLGVYDYRKRNAAAASPEYLEKHRGFLGQAAYAQCWLTMFSPADNARLQALSAGDQANGKTSDYCPS